MMTLLSRLRSVVLPLALACAAVPALAASDVAVEVKNESEPVLCAEKDNVTIKAISPEVRRFQIEAAHPAYNAGLLRDNWDADWTDCEMKGDPSFAAPVPPRRVTFYESTEYWLVGYTFPTFWRPADTTFRVGDRVEKGLHLVQLWKLGKDRSHELLVVYPQDGYWRARPMPPQQLASSAYGSSFLFGPIETDGRPVVNIKEIEFDPKTTTFKLSFKDGSSGSLKLDSVDENRMVLDAVLDKPGDRRQGFRGAALDVCHRVQQRRCPHRGARARCQGLARGGADAVHGRQGDRYLDGPDHAFAPQHLLARHGLPQFLEGPEPAGQGRRRSRPGASSTAVISNQRRFAACPE
jgi:hypothetical protein